MQLDHLQIIVRLVGARASESHTFVYVRVIVRAITIRLRTGLLSLTCLRSCYSRTRARPGRATASSRRCRSESMCTRNVKPERCAMPKQ